MKIKSNRRSIVEYVLTLSLISFLAIFITVTLGVYIKNGITKLSCQISDSTYVEKVHGSSYCKK